MTEISLTKSHAHKKAHRPASHNPPVTQNQLLNKSLKISLLYMSLSLPHPKQTLNVKTFKVLCEKKIILMNSHQYNRRVTVLPGPMGLFFSSLCRNC